MPGGRVWGHLGIVEITLGGLGTFPAACQKQVVKSGRHIASIWEPFGSVVAPLALWGALLRTRTATIVPRSVQKIIFVAL